MIVALYARVSTKQHGQDPETQLQPLRDYAAAKKCTILQEYVDLGVSGSKEGRPQLDRLMADARAKKFDAVLVWRFDRFARSVPHLLKALGEFGRLGIDFISMTESIDTSTAVGRMVFTILAAVAEMERSLIRERVQAGLNRARRQGKSLGRPRVLVDEVCVLELFRSGHSVRSIARAVGVSEATLRRIIALRQKAKCDPTQKSVAGVDLTA